MRMRTGRHLRSKGHEVSRRLMSDRFGTQSVTAAELEGLKFCICGFEGICMLKSLAEENVSKAFLLFYDLKY